MSGEHTGPSPAAEVGDGLRVREVRWQDLDELAVLEQRCFADDAWSVESFWAELAQRPRRDYLVLERAGTVVGYAGLDVVGEVADVMTVAVDPGLRGTGLGAVLLEQLHERARSAGATSVMLEVRDDNGPARGLYESRGYAVVRTRQGYYASRDGAPAADALVMRRELA